MKTEESHGEARPGRANGGPARPPQPFADEAAGKKRATRKAAPADHLINGRYRLLGQVRQGRLGPVFEAADELGVISGIGRHVALQLLDAKAISGRRFTGEFERGLQSLQSISHPNIVGLLEAGRDEGHCFLVTELPDSGTLRFVLNDVGQLPLEEAAAVIGSCGNALQYLHAKQIVHGDLKPENVLVTFDYEVKLQDLVPSDWSTALPGDPDQRDDVYGLACLTYEMLAGKHPFNGNTPDEAHHAGLKPAPIGLLSAKQWRALAAALELQRELRTPTVAQFLEEFGVTGGEKLLALVEGDAEKPAAAAPEPAPAFAPASAPGPTPGFSRASAPTAAWYAPDLLQPARAVAAERSRTGTGRKLLSLILLAGVVYAFLDLDTLRTDFASFVASIDSQVPRDSPGEPASAPDDATQKTADAENSAAAEEPAADDVVAADREITAARPDGPAAAREPAKSPAAITGSAEVPAPAAAAAARPAVLQAPRFSFDRSSIRVAESEVAARIVISRSGDTTQPGAVIWWTDEGSALAGQDFADLGRRIEKFAAGETQRTVFVPLVNDTNAESAKSFNVYLGRATGNRRAVEPQSGMRVDIADDD